MLPFIFIRDRNKYVKICFDEIVYVEALDNYLCLVTETNKYTIRGTLVQFEKMLPANIFCRIHRSYIVSLYHIKAFNKSFVFVKEVKLPVAEQYKDDLPQRVQIFPAAEQDIIEL